ncbi:hypothetical protein M784_06085 [Neisseria gonorrhoeae MU_NG19]|nr:hypothetical protein M784_06085 [Neisseria gonorrhoeae MU_NG19]
MVKNPRSNPLLAWLKVLKQRMKLNQRKNAAYQRRFDAKV